MDGFKVKEIKDAPHTVKITIYNKKFHLKGYIEKSRLRNGIIYSTKYLE